MIHYTLNTGHTRDSPRSEVSDSAIAAVQHILTRGETHEIPGTTHVCGTATQGRGLICSVRDIPGRPCVSFGVAFDEQSATGVWEALERLYLEISDKPPIAGVGFAAPHQPTSLPWCAATVIFATPDEASWIADFERVVAWAWIEKMRNQ